ncbi:MAG: EF-P beta-lysylation protein EpmB [Agarilytica sp.]
MIPRTIATWQSKSWQEELATLVKEPETLFELLELPETHLSAAKHAHALFPLRSTRAYLSRIKPGDLNDPLLKQILPMGLECHEQEGFVTDPLHEAEQNPVPGLIHKYQGRVLLISSHQCAINCRYCFRRHFDYQGQRHDKDAWQHSLDYIANDNSISEAILSGGDPLSISDKALNAQISDLAQIPHLKRLRVHSRLPIVAPSRITPELLRMLSESRLHSVLVIHCNHPQEIDQEVRDALCCVRENGITLLNQSVLLKGINDDANTLEQLSETLFECGVLPYYLHLVDKVSGVAHFHVNEDKARSLHKALLATLPGYLVPKLVKELPHAPSKTPIM